MMRSLTFKLISSFVAAVVAGMVTTTAWRYGVLQELVEQQGSQPDWTAVVGGAAGGVICTVDFWVRSRCKYFAATMTAAASLLLGGFFWATKHFGYWEEALSHVGDFGPSNAPWVVAGAGAAYAFYVFLVMLCFGRSRL